MKRIKDICERLESWKSVGVSALFLVAGFSGMMADIGWLEQLAWGSVVLSGLPLAREALETLWADKRITSGLLITIAIVASLIIGETFAAGEIAFIMAIGELLEHGAVARARRGLERLLTLTPPRGRRISGGNEEMAAYSEIRKGDLLRVAPGESIPADGVIESGRTSIDQSILTGESLPVERKEGDEAFAGAINGDGSIDIRATHDGSDSSLQRMIRLVEEAGEKQAPIQREADRWARRIVPASISIALAGYIALRLLGCEQGEAALRAVTTLVVFCPCALALATPTSIMAAIGQAAKNGVIIKSGESLETLGRIDTLAFDKTGTLTKGQPAVACVHAVKLGKEKTLALAAALESRSEHPLGKAIVAAAGGERLAEVTDFRALPGRGAQGVAEGRALLCGNEACMTEGGVGLDEEARAILGRLRGQGMTAVLLAEGNELLGIIGLQDSTRPSTPQTLGALGSLRKILLTGDNACAAQRFAEPLKMDGVYADLLPGEKSGIIEKMQQSGSLVAMVGDGVNDAPALKQANVGIAMSRLGSDIATEAADISLMNDDLGRLPYLMRLARATLGNIRFNIAASLAINMAAVALSLAGALTPVTGALAHNAGSLVVILNAALLYDRKFE